jgi:hypothetical protein
MLADAYNKFKCLIQKSTLMAEQVTSWISKNLINIFLGIISYFLVQLGNKFDRVESTLQQILINQEADRRDISELKNKVVKLEAYKETHQEDVKEFFESYKLEKK